MTELKPLKKKRQIIVFDYDGTLHETMRIYKPAIEDVIKWLRVECGREAGLPSDERISSWLGMNTADMWRDFMPELEADMRQRAGRRVGAHMLANLQKGLGGWYPGIEQMLDTVCGKGFLPVVLSNCGNSYARAHWDCFGMERWFAAFFACETWNDAPKTDIMRSIRDDFAGAIERSPVKRPDFAAAVKGMSADGSQSASADRLQSMSADGFQIAAVVGDRGSDLAGAKAAGVPFVGCLYGYGSQEELAGAGAFAGSPEEIVPALEKLL